MHQYSIGLPGYQQIAPFVPSLLVEFRKWHTDEILGEINGYGNTGNGSIVLLKYNSG